MREPTRGSDRRWRVGEVAEATGLTVRTLHHYEQIGLLPPASRTEGNQRLYDEDDVRRLYRVRALRELGLSLPEIRRTLDDEGAPIGELLREHLARVELEIARLSRLRERLERSCAHADALGDADALLATIEAMTRIERHIDARAASGPSTEDRAAAWRGIGEALRACMDAGDEPSSPRARALARRARARILAFAGDDPTIEGALGRLRRGAPNFNQAGWDDPLLRYLDRALAALDDAEGEEDAC